MSKIRVHPDLIKEIHLNCEKCGEEEIITKEKIQYMWRKSIGGYEYRCHKCGHVNRFIFMPEKTYPTHIDGVLCTGATNSFTLK